MGERGGALVSGAASEAGIVGDRQGAGDWKTCGCGYCGGPARTSAPGTIWPGLAIENRAVRCIIRRRELTGRGAIQTEIKGESCR